MAPTKDFDSQIERRDNPKGCAMWTGPTFGEGGWPVAVVDGERRLAHRVAWERKNGKKIPLYYALLPTVCDERLCVEPEHHTLHKF